MRGRGWGWGLGLLLWGVALVLCLDALTPRAVLLDESGRRLFAFPLYLGDAFEMEYIHSVQLCPVVDRYYSNGRRFWLWEERTQSTNAGLPTEAPPRGRFVHEPPWYRYIGGGRSFESLILRVGDARWGRNTLTLPWGETVPLFERYPGRRLTLCVRQAAGLPSR